MSIFPLPVFEQDADPSRRDALTDEEIYERLEPPKTIVVRFGRMKLIGEYNYDGDAKPGCGSKLVARTFRGTELVEMLTSTCPNTGCSKAISRQEMLEYIENSGGKDYPFHKNGRIIRVATVEDMNAQSALEPTRQEGVRVAKRLINEMNLPMQLVDAEPILGGEVLTFYYMSEDRVDFRDLVKELAAVFSTRIEMRQVGARDEARLVADYERCGQHCCCKNFLKVLKPVSMRSAKQQKATLEPLKISGRCGRLMCCLRYEDESYRELRKRLPNRKSRVGTVDGPGIVLETKTLVQLVLVRLEADGREVAYPVEELMDPEECPSPEEIAARQDEADPFRGLNAEEVEQRVNGRGDGGKKSKDQQQDDFREASQRRGKKRRRRRGKRSDAQAKSSGAGEAHDGPATDSAERSDDDGSGKSSSSRKRKRNRRRRGRKRSGPAGSGGDADRDGDSSGGSGASGGESSSKGRGKRRRRRGGRKRRAPGSGGTPGSSSNPENPRKPPE